MTRIEEFKKILESMPRAESAKKMVVVYADNSVGTARKSVEVSVSLAYYYALVE